MNQKMSIISQNSSESLQINSSSLFSLLNYFGLSQYYPQLLSIGLQNSNPLIQLLNIPNRRKFVNHLSLMPGHHNRFLRMFSKLEKFIPREGKFIQLYHKTFKFS
jgi:hypothetical protein